MKQENVQLVLNFQPHSSPLTPSDFWLLSKSVSNLFRQHWVRGQLLKQETMEQYEEVHLRAERAKVICIATGKLWCFGDPDALHAMATHVDTWGLMPL